jgi:hypothetical protein
LQQQGWPLLPAVHFIELDYHEVRAMGQWVCAPSCSQLFCQLSLLCTLHHVTHI